MVNGTRTPTSGGEGRTSLYRVFGAGGALLYVGISKHALARFHEHSKDKEWWAQAEHVAVEHFNDRQSAAAAEARAIRSERPLFNVVHAVKPAAASSVGESRAITWRCFACGEPVADGDGWITVSMDEVSEYRRAMDEFWKVRAGDRSLSGSDIASMPDRARWKVYHCACDPDRDATAYWFDIDQCRTEADLLRVTSHVLGKAWSSMTDWLGFMETRGRPS